MAEWGKISSLFRLEKVLRPEQFDATSMVTLPRVYLSDMLLWA